MDDRTTVFEAARYISNRVTGLHGVITCVKEAAASNNPSAKTLQESISYALELLERECDTITDALESLVIDPLKQMQ